MKELYNLKKDRYELLDEAKTALNAKDMDAYNAKMADVERLNAEIDAREKLDAELGRFDEADKHMLTIHDTQEKVKKDLKDATRLDAARSGNEYAQAFAEALVTGATIKNGVKNEKLAPLYNALTISGGSPTGADGGFLVPIDFDDKIQRKMKEFVRLSDYFHVEDVTTTSGWRAVETTASRKVLPKIGENTKITTNDQPSFAKVEYTIEKYGDRLPISQELLEDNTAGLLDYLAEWFAPRVVMTENSLLLALLDTLTAANLESGSEVKGIKQALNVGLNTAISRNAILLANQSGYAHLDELEDANGRPLLKPSITDPRAYMFDGRPIVAMDNDLLPNRTVTTSGATKGDYYPIYIGYMQAFGTLFRRKALEFRMTDIGGDAWANDAPEVRGIVRMDAQKVDENAAVKREIFIAASE